MPRGVFCYLLGTLAMASSLAQSQPPAVVYEVFVQSFADSDEDGMGDLRGLTQRLDYIAKLGADAIWLMPIHPSPSYHKYDVVDYRAIHPDYGSMADFDSLLSRAHALGLEVILDLVINHSSDQISIVGFRPPRPTQLVPTAITTSGQTTTPSLRR